MKMRSSVLGVGAAAVLGLGWVTACGSSSSGPSGSGVGGGGAASAAGSAGTANGGGTAGNGGTASGGALETGGSGASSGSGGAAGSAVSGSAGRGGADEEAGGAAGSGGEGGAIEEGPQTPVSRITLRRQFSEDVVVPVAVEQPEATESKGLWLVSSHLILDERLANMPSLEWLGEVANFGEQVVCTPFVKVVFYAGGVQGLERFSLSASVGAKKVLTSLTKSPIRCLAPGERAPAWSYTSNDAHNKVEDSSVAVVSWLSDSTTEVEPDPHAPTLQDLTVQGNDASGYNVHGFIHMGSVALSSVDMNFYPRLDGVLADRLTRTLIGEELPAGGQKEFASFTFPQQFSSFATSFDYFEVSSP